MKTTSTASSKTLNSTPALAIFGLGRMGGQIARRLTSKGFPVIAWNRSPEPVEEIRKAGVSATADLAGAVTLLYEKTDPKQPRIFWVMLPHKIVDDFIFGTEHLGQFLRKGDIVIDGGNSYYKDSMKRAAKLAKKGIHFFDCGTSGGVHGEKNGFALMIGGEKKVWHIVEPIFEALSSGPGTGPEASGYNYALLGKAGAGHFTKMVHNGIEYGMMEAIGEGYAVLEASPFKLNLTDVTRVYQKGSVVRSWLIDLCRNIFEHENVKGTVGKIDATGEGEWTVKAGEEFGVDVRVIRSSLDVRRESAEPKNQKKYSNKIVALLRKQFGGHAIYSKTDAV
ncbi:MAG TPA: decarboxylating 6-phosphogluconate dehydrogenase [Candidatus Paceibacterota bacterium]